MISSFALIFLAGLAMAALCQKIRLPRIIGMLATGILLGPFCLNLLDGSLLAISASLRQMALVIILIKAGLSLDLGDLKKVGRPALLMSCLPATFEIAAWVLLAPMLLPIGRMEAAVIGAILGAVSPAVVVPKMVQLMENRWGTGKGIPQLILAGASLDDVYVIVVFTTFLGMTQGGSASWSAFGRIPVSILTGIGVGALTGLFLSALFESCYRRRQMIRNSTKTIVILGTAFLLVSLVTAPLGAMGMEASYQKLLTRQESL